MKPVLKSALAVASMAVLAVVARWSCAGRTAVASSGRRSRSARRGGALGLGFSSRGIAPTQRFPEFFTALAVALPGRMIPAPGGVSLRAASAGIVGAIGSPSVV